MVKTQYDTPGAFQTWLLTSTRTALTTWAGIAGYFCRCKTAGRQKRTNHCSDWKQNHYGCCHNTAKGERLRIYLKEKFGKSDD